MTPPFTVPPAKLPVWGRVVAIVAAVLLLVGYTAYSFVDGWRQADRLDRSLQEPFDPLPTHWTDSEPVTPPPLDPTEEQSPAPTGPRASTYPVREDDDLARVCDGWYYPTSPKFTGKAPHQISVGVIDTKVVPNRIFKSSVSVPDLKESIWRAWMPTTPAKSQLVGCVDLVRSAGKVATCNFDDPKPEKIQMNQAFYRVRLYETATGRKLLDKPVTGEDEKCPTLVFLIGEKNIYSEVSDRQIYELFRPFVMRK